MFDDFISFVCVEIEYLQICLKHNLKTEKPQPVTKRKSAWKLNWTADKINLVELIYALFHVNCINNGKVKIKDLIEAFEMLFSVELGEYYRTYVEIGRRKLETGKFMRVLLAAIEEDVAKSHRK